MSFRRFLENSSSLLQQLQSVRPMIAQAAQQIYDAWEQSEEGLDDEFGGGGICDQISRVIADTVFSAGIDVDVTDGTSPGDDHAYPIFYTDTEAFGIDIPHHVYETGGGYSWRKIPGVTFQPDDVEIWAIERSWIEPEEYY